MINFRELVDALAAEPDIWLARNTIFPGARPAAIEQAEKILGAPLHLEIKEFYRHHNGLAIEWMFKKTETFQEDYREIGPELPLWEELLISNWEDDSIRFDGQIIVLPIEDVFIERYDQTVEDNSPFRVEEPFASEFGYMANHEVNPTTPSSEPLIFGEKKFTSEIAFRAQLRYFDYFMSDDSILLLLEQGQSNPPLLYLEADVANFDPDYTCPLSEYLQRVALDFGLISTRYDYFRQLGAPPVAPPQTLFDAASQLSWLIATTEFHGDLRE